MKQQTKYLSPVFTDTFLTKNNIAKFKNLEQIFNRYEPPAATTTFAINRIRNRTLSAARSRCGDFHKFGQCAGMTA